LNNEHEKLRLVTLSASLCGRKVKKNYTKMSDHGSQHSDHPSQKSAVTATSSLSCVAARTRAKAKAAQVRAEYAKQKLGLARRQGELEKQRIEVEAEAVYMEALAEAAAIDAEASVLESCEEASAYSSPKTPHPSITAEEAAHSTARHLLSQTNDAQSRTREYVQSLPDHDAMSNESSPPSSAGRINHNNNSMNHVSISTNRDNNSNSAHEELSKFLLKKELLLNRLSVFNEEPGAFTAWKMSFKSVMNDFGTTPQEELDLLVKYLGPESARYARSMQISSAGNPKKGLELLWDRLEDRFGSPELIEAHLKAKITAFPEINDNRKLYELCDLMDEVHAAQENPSLASVFSIYNTSSGANLIVNKLPPFLRQKWVGVAAKYKSQHKVPFPPFSTLLKFVREMSKIYNDPAFQLEKPSKSDQYAYIRTRMSGIIDNSDVAKLCPIHKTQHHLAACKKFASKSFEEKRALLKEKSLCYKCLLPGHSSRQCKATVKCDVCGKGHLTVMHRMQALDPAANQSSSADPPPSRSSHGGEKPSLCVNNRCTALCGSLNASRSCGKIVPVNVFNRSQPSKSMKVYAVIDDQSNRSLASPALLDGLGVTSEEFMYTLTSCSGSYSMSGRSVSGLCVQSLDAQVTLDLPPVIECNTIPEVRSEIPTPEVAQCHTHLQRLAAVIPPNDARLPFGLLVGRDLPEAHHVLDQIIGPPMSPFAQRLPLGWVIVGDVCLQHKSTSVNAKKTCVDHNSHDSFIEPCRNHIKLREVDDIASDVFKKTPEDEVVGLSVEDKKFLAVMDGHFKKDSNGRWSAPLPLKSEDPVTVCNRAQALNRAHGLHASMQKDPIKREHMFKFMSQIFASGSAERAPPTKPDGRSWYLPFFGVYHPKKPGKIRGVFDSSATFQGLSLNKMLLSGPDLSNSLVGIIMRFRRDAYAIQADIEQMFYQFFVDPEHRDFLRFFWYQDNDFTQPLVEYRMTVHVFGNSPSPAVATYGLRKTVADSEDDVKAFVNRDFYVDDGCKSLPTKEQAVDLLSRTQADLKQNGDIRLHKVASNDRDVLMAFPTDDLCEEIKGVDLSDPSAPLPVHSCLGLPWNLETDTFSVNLEFGSTPFTRRGILSTLNSIYDPLGFLAPAVISGKILLREISPKGKAWDEQLSTSDLVLWEQWKQSLKPLQSFDLPRMYVPTSLSTKTDYTFHVFSDASEKAIAAVVYVQVPSAPKSGLGFVIGKAKVAPTSGHTIPRLELCSALLATELWQLVSAQLQVDLHNVTFYTDSKVVLGYINNETRRFYTYVSNRVERIRHTSHPGQWKYIPTTSNPADLATRCVMEDVHQKVEAWLRGPTDFLQDSSLEAFPLISPDSDSEIRPIVKKTGVADASLPPPLSTRFEKFSSWVSLVRALCLLKHVSQSFHSSSDTCKGWHSCAQHHSVDSAKATEQVIFKTVQREFYAEEMACLLKGECLPKSSSIRPLSPYLDKDGLLRVGGRLQEATETLDLPYIHPLILPKSSHVSSLLVRYYHDKMKHQGRHFTEGALRSAGFWIVGAKRLVSSMIGRCFTCRRLRGKTGHQQMGNLPADKVNPSAPFSHVGVDVFGPWSVSVRKTRGGSANAKRWAVLFTCMATRAIHIEVIEEMTSDSFINALRRFVALRGPIVALRSDRGTNFVGAAGELEFDALFKEDGPVLHHLRQSGVTWSFNPPYAHHMGGSWERLIGVARRVLDAILLDAKRKPLTHEVLCTFMAEVSAIVNSRPLVPISHDPDSPLVLTPSMLLTSKCGQEHVQFDSTDIKQTYKDQWKHVQVLANTFWKHWKEEYLQTLQQRRKWTDKQPNICENDLVLIKDSTAHRNDWLIGLVTRSFPSTSDSLVRTAEVRIASSNGPTYYVRPVTELVPLWTEAEIF
jgi:hypothetical protein